METRMRQQMFLGRAIVLLAFFMAVFPVWLNGPAWGYSKSSTPEKNLKVGDPVSAASGEYFFTMPLFDLGGPLPLAYTLSHRTNQVSSGAFGMSPFDHNVPIVDYGADSLSISPYNGDDIVSFIPQDGSWTVADNSPVPYVLRETGAGADTGYLYLMDPIAEQVHIFEKKTGWGERLRWVMDRNGNRLTYTYPSALVRYPTRIEDGLGRSLDITYPTGTVGTITDHAGRQVTMGYGGELNLYLTSVTDPLTNRTDFVYDDTHKKVTQKKEPLGNVPYTQTYDTVTLNGTASVRVTTQTDAYGNAASLAYDPAGTDVTETRPDANTGVYDHYPAPAGAGMEGGAPRKFTDADSKTIDFAANTQEQITQVTDRLGDATSFTYHEGSGKPVSITNAKGQTVTYTYTAQDQTFTNPVDSHEETFTFYNLTRIDYPDTTNERFTYDAKGNMLTRIDRAGKTWRYTYNGRGQVLTETNPPGGVTTYTYNADATAATLTDSDRGIIAFGYDACKRVNSITYPGGAVVQLTYDANDRLTSFIDENGQQTTLTYDANGNLVKMTDPVNGETLYGYDLMDRPVTITDRLGKASTMTYDSMDRLSRIADATGVRSVLGYDPRGWLNAVTRAGKTWTTGYDDEGVPASRTTPLSRTTIETTDKLGLIERVKDPLNQETVFGRDAMNRIVSETDPRNQTTQYAYDARGALSGVTLPTAAAAAYAYNDLGLLGQITDLNNRLWTFAYTTMGRLQTLTDPLTRATAYTYDTRGRMNGVTYPGGGTQTITYDGTGNILRRQYTGGPDLQYTYDALNRLLTANDITLGRDAEGRVTATTQAGNVFGASYDHAGRVASATYNNSAFTVNYTYDVGENGTGLLTGVADTLTGTQIAFAYDDDRRLRTVTLPNGETITYTWDNASRLTRLQSGGHVDLALTYDAADRITSVDMTAPLTPEAGLTPSTQTLSVDAASQISTTGYAYDSRGRQTAAPSHAFTWDDASRLTAIDAVTLAYNGLGDVLTRSEGGSITRFHYNRAIAGAPLMAEQNATTGNFMRYYVWTPGGRLLYMIDASAGNAVRFYHFDQVGSTLALTDTNAAVTDAWAYDPYGRILSRTGDTPQPFTFVGAWGVRQEGENSTLFQMRARYYDALTGRFLSPEPLWPRISDPRALNPYQYAMNSPVSAVDRTGMGPEATYIPDMNMPGLNEDPSLIYGPNSPQAILADRLGMVPNVDYGPGNRQAVNKTPGLNPPPGVQATKSRQTSGPDGTRSAKVVLETIGLAKNAVGVVKKIRNAAKAVKAIKVAKVGSGGLKAALTTMKVLSTEMKTKGAIPGMIASLLLDLAISAERIYQMVDASRNSARVGEENQFVWYDPFTYAGNRMGHGVADLIYGPDYVPNQPRETYQPGKYGRTYGNLCDR